MNDSSKVDKNTLTQDGALNTLMYLTGSYLEGSEDGRVTTTIPDGTSVNDILSMVEEKMSKDANVSDDMKRKLEVVQSAVRNQPSVGELVIANQTANMLDPETGLGYEARAMRACTFQDSLTNPQKVNLVFSGTGEGVWWDDSNLLSGQVELAWEQEKAIAYYNSIVQKNGWAYSTPDIHATSHSKGGSDVSAIMMKSYYSDLISSAYMIDSPGESPETLETWKNELGDQEFDYRRKKLYIFSPDNDFVNPLGYPVAASDQIYYLGPSFPIKSIEDIKKFHESDAFMTNDGKITSFTEIGVFGDLIRYTSNEVMKLSPEDRRIITDGAMWYLQNMHGDPVGPVTYDVNAYEAQERLTAMIMYVFHNNPGYASLLVGFFDGAVREGGVFPGIGSGIGGFLGASGYALAPFAKDIQNRDWNNTKAYINQLADIFDELSFAETGEKPKRDADYYARWHTLHDWIVTGKLRVSKYTGKIELSNDVSSSIRDNGYKTVTKEGFLVAVRSLVDLRIRQIEEEKRKAASRKDDSGFFQSFRISYRLAKNSPEIVVDTEKLREYYSRLVKVTRRLSDVSVRLTRLTIRDGDPALVRASKNLAGIVKSQKITKCGVYLKSTAENFEKIEKELNRMVPNSTKGKSAGKQK